MAVPSNTRINGPHHGPIALAQIQAGELVSVLASGDSSSSLTAARIHVYCNCHWVGGTIASRIGQLQHPGWPHGAVRHRPQGAERDDPREQRTPCISGGPVGRIAFSDLQVGQGAGVVFSADGSSGRPASTRRPRTSRPSGSTCGATGRFRRPQPTQAQRRRPPGSLPGSGTDAAAEVGPLDGPDLSACPTRLTTRLPFCRADLPPVFCRESPLLDCLFQPGRAEDEQTVDEPRPRTGGPGGDRERSTTPSRSVEEPPARLAIDHSCGSAFASLRRGRLERPIASGTQLVFAAGRPHHSPAE